MEEVLTPDVFDRLRQAMSADVGGLADLYRDYLEDARRTLATLHKASQESDFEQLRVAAHYLKGSSQILGARNVAQCCVALEERMRSGSLDRIERLLHATEAAVEAVEKEVARRLGAAAVSAKKTVGRRDQVP